MGINDERGGGKLCLAIVAVAVILLSSFAVFTEDSNADSIAYGYVKVKVGDSYVQNEDDSEDFGTMVAALTKANSIETSKEVIIECESGKPINFVNAHGPFIKRSVTIEGNDAYAMTGSTLGGDFAIENSEGRELLTDTDLIIKSLHCVTVWGYRSTTHTLMVEMNKCNSYVQGYPNNSDKTVGSGVMMRSDDNPISNAKLIMTINDCNFNKGVGTGSVIHTTYNCSLYVTNCNFIGVPEPINLNTKTQATDVSAVVMNSSFTDCGAGTTVDQKQYSAPIRVVNSKSTSGSSSVLVDNCTFSYNSNVASSNGDVLIGDGRSGKTSNAVSLTVKNTDATIEWLSPDYYDKSGNVADSSKIVSQTVSKNNLVITDGVPTLCTVDVSSGDGGSVSVNKLFVSPGISVSSSGNMLKVGSQTISATAAEGYIFSKWTVPSGGVITEDVKTISAEFTKSSSGTVESESTNTTTVVTKTDDKASVVTEIKIDSEANMDQAVQEAIEQVTAMADGAGTTDVVKQIVIPTTTEKVEVSEESVEAIVEAKVDLTVKNSSATVTLKATTLSDVLNTSSTESKAIKIEVVSETELTPSQTAKVGSNQYIDVTAYLGDEQVHDIGKNAVVSVPCTISGKVKVSYVNDEGVVTDISSTYSDGYVTFTTEHFSVYMISKVKSSSFVDIPDMSQDEFSGYVPTQKTTDSASDDSAKIAVLVGAIVVVLVAIVAMAYRSR